MSDIITTVKGNLAKFMPKALRKRYGRAAGSAGFRPGTRVLARDDGGAELPAIVIEDLGGSCVRVRFDDGEILDLVASALRKAPRRRRSPSAEMAPDGDGEPERGDAA